MITGIEGRPGSGKSYYAMECIMEDIMRGKTIYTNMRNIHIHKVAWEVSKRRCIPRERVFRKIRFIDTWEVERLWKEKVENSEVYLDEVMTSWLSRDWSKMDRGLIEWFSQHRKYRVNFTYIAQSIDRVDSTLRDMTQEFINIRNFAYYKIGFIRLPQVFLLTKYAEDRKLVLKREWIIPIRKYYGFYDSWALFPNKPIRPVSGNVVGIRSGVGEMGDQGGILTESDMRESRQSMLNRYGVGG
jgi:hypothetical protein